ncbi:hypothetical protein DU508_12505 [Pedobacter chinensis]|uniref:Uncharacterized protein n=1 Tax=Pedobacter chinensis TaxID=2282421 RepID=A0A369PV73_9SPHI|nr:hypothetical protein [Pedobacter chinensis]RDC56414.1 hypothetical protein DU508_12505 [Pedobacter chinensis]
MKNKITLNKISYCLIFLSFLTLTFTGCKKEEDTQTLELKYRTLAWNYLNDQSKSSVRINWKEAPITYSTKDNEEVAEVMFYTTDDALLGPIIVCISIKTKTVLGVGARF